MFTETEKELMILALQHESNRRKGEYNETDAFDKLIAKIERNGWINAGLHVPSGAEDVLAVTEDGKVVMAFRLPISGEWYRSGIYEDAPITPVYWKPIEDFPRTKKNEDA